MAAIANPGLFKANKNNPEKMLENFDIYVDTFKNLLMVTDNAAATQEKKERAS